MESHYQKALSIWKEIQEHYRMFSKNGEVDREKCFDADLWNNFSGADTLIFQIVDGYTSANQQMQQELGQGFSDCLKVHYEQIEDIIIRHKLNDYRLQFYFLIIYYLSGDFYFDEVNDEDGSRYSFKYKNERPLSKRDEENFNAFKSILNDDGIDALKFTSPKGGESKINHKPLVQSIQKLIEEKWEELFLEHSDYFYRSTQKLRKVKKKSEEDQVTYYDPELFYSYCLSLSRYFLSKCSSKNISFVLAGWILFFTGRISFNESGLKKIQDGNTIKKWRLQTKAKKTLFENVLRDKIKASIRQHSL